MPLAAKGSDLRRTVAAGDDAANGDDQDVQEKVAAGDAGKELKPRQLRAKIFSLTMGSDDLEAQVPHRNAFSTGTSSSFLRPFWTTWEPPSPSLR